MKIINKAKLNAFRDNLLKLGTDQLFIVSDFDSTLISPYANGKYIPSLMGLLREKNLLPDAWKQKSTEMYNYYTKEAEIDGNLTYDKRVELMEEWWSKAYDLLKESGFKYEHILNVAKDQRLKYREGVEDFMKWCQSTAIPFIIMSATGLGSDCIAEFLRVRGDLYENVEIISNNLTWDKSGDFIGAEKPYVHSLNKYGQLIRDNLVYGQVKARKMALLFGDDIGDAQMLSGFDIKTLKVYISSKDDDITRNINKNFDIILEKDDSFNKILELLEIINENQR